MSMNDVDVLTGINNYTLDFTSQTHTHTLSHQLGLINDGAHKYTVYKDRLNE